MILVTGAAGFIGFHVARRLLEAGRDVAGVDTINAYYDPALKRARLEALSRFKGFRFTQADIAEEGALEAAAPLGAVTHIVHLAAQPGVRYSLEAPLAYEHANVRGHLRVLEYARRAPKLEHLVYASSSSVYGDRADGPFRESDRCDEPASLYAATKRAAELMSHTYAHLHGVKSTGLRFFTVYGEWGRPDMAVWLFTESVIAGKPIKLFSEGRLKRDFTHVDDVAPAVIALMDLPPEKTPPHDIYNLGNSRPTIVLDLVRTIEQAVGKPANIDLAPPQKTEVTATFADHARATARFGFQPKTTIEEGVPRFVAWYRQRYN
jgi:UDP-glucuronate 4-epimerase